MTAALIAKLESASEGSRELDALIWANYQPEKVKVTGWNEPYGDSSGRSQIEFTLPPKRMRCVTSDSGQYPHAEPVTTSIDAALALAERVFPGITFRIDLDGVSRVWAFDKETFWNIHATINSRPKDWSAHAQAATPALAICAAITRASAAERAG